MSLLTALMCMSPWLCPDGNGVSICSSFLILGSVGHLLSSLGHKIISTIIYCNLRLKASQFCLSWKRLILVGFRAYSNRLDNKLIFYFESWEFDRCIAILGGL